MTSSSSSSSVPVGVAIAQRIRRAAAGGEDGTTTERRPPSVSLVPQKKDNDDDKAETIIPTNNQSMDGGVDATQTQTESSFSSTTTTTSSLRHRGKNKRQSPPAPPQDGQHHPNDSLSSTSSIFRRTTTRGGGGGGQADHHHHSNHNQQRHRRNRQRKKPITSWQVFLAGSFLYAGCVYLPKGLLLVLRFFLLHEDDDDGNDDGEHDIYYHYNYNNDSSHDLIQDWSSSLAQMLIFLHVSDSWRSFLLAGVESFLTLLFQSILLPLGEFLHHPLAMIRNNSTMRTTTTTTTTTKLPNMTTTGIANASYASSSFEAAMTRTTPRLTTATVAVGTGGGGLWSPDTSSTDVLVVLVLSSTLALIRFAITKALVPLKKKRPKHTTNPKKMDPKNYPKNNNKNKNKNKPHHSNDEIQNEDDQWSHYYDPDDDDYDDEEEEENYRQQAVQALVKCKSVHLLSQDYPLTPQISRKNIMEPLMEEEETMRKRPHDLYDNDDSDEDDEDNPNDLVAGSSSRSPALSTTSLIPVLPDFDSESRRPPKNQEDHDFQSYQLRLQSHNNNNNNNRDVGADTLQITIEKRRNPNLDGKDETNITGRPAVFDTTSANTFAVESKPLQTRLQALQQQQERRLQQQQQEEQYQQHRFYAAPRMATALFRLVYSMTAVVLAWNLFHDTSFWPWYVGGRGTTKACWDLSATLVFLEQGVVVQSLKQYFLWQASYHCHAGLFHILTSIWLWVHLWKRQRRKQQRKHKPQQQQQQKQQSQQSSSQSSHTRHLFSMLWNTAGATSFSTSSLIQHVLALVLIGTAYIFSSLRRLGAVAMFAFDVSSIFLHLLQLAMNYYTYTPPSPPVVLPKGNAGQQQQQHSSEPLAAGSGRNHHYQHHHSSRRQTVVCRFIFYCGVLPSFIVGRFLIWFALWYSAWTAESAHWFHQLEQTLFQGTSWGLQCLCNTSLLTLITYNVWHFVRLVGGNHPHLQRLLRDDTNDNNDDNNNEDQDDGDNSPEPPPPENEDLPPSLSCPPSVQSTKSIS